MAAVVIKRLRSGKAPCELGKLSGAIELIVTGTGRATGDFGEESCASLEDFAWSHGRQLPSQEFAALLHESHGAVLPYCVDGAARAVIFARCDPTWLGKSTFMYQAQRRHATCLYAVPFAELIRLVDRETIKTPAWSAQVMLVQSTGRCGSTLLSKLLDCVGSVVSLSEPDVYLSLLGWLMLGKAALPKHELHALLRAFTYCLTLYRPGQPLAIKFRAQQLAQSGDFKAAMPLVRQIYLYRNGLDTVDSYGMAFFNSRLTRWVRYFRLDVFFIYRTGPLRRYFEWFIPLYNTEIYPPAVVQPLGYVGFIALSWLCNMQAALDAVEKNPTVFDAILTYEQLVTHRWAAVRCLLERCGLGAHVVAGEVELAHIFDEDAHVAGGRTASAKRRLRTAKALFIPEDDVMGVLDLMARHPVIKTPDFQLPGTMEGLG